jgi:hypothetical protein
MSKIVATHVTVDAHVDVVWQTLTDLTNYHRWNPFITSAAGTFDVGERLDLTIQPPGGKAMRFRPWVTAVEEHRYLEWLGRRGMPGFFDGRHSFTLTPIASGRTLIQQSETFSGALVPFTGSTLARTRAGFNATNLALATWATRPADRHHGDDPD